ncbi:hypothetical protein FOHLNKBM_1243 [Methylobacterium longum]|uniref:DUF3572 domain-containing protein n=2 Tax=Methylobacteriaceae TaxID=119045 RepID=A0ABT8AUA8_9HYPH|nr:DUF3572 domain-containing protein [Methylobacterium longum]MDN3573533.1 DUF3572 domain-containing protein [Methylobacterium longum]GJE10210.1 hypothetical protein FOHLNKBM_1243 [Methylobacterium longum]
MNGKPLQGHEPAERLALDVLLWIAGDEDRLLPFMAASGLSPDTLRESAREPAFLVGVLDHVMGDENVLLACATALEIKPERIAEAWQRLSPRPDDEWA